MLFSFLLLVLGLAALAKSSELTIRIAERFSYLTGINKVVIGFVFIAVITSLPELSIAFLSSIRGEALLSVGNVIGANVMNISLIFGIISLMTVVRISKSHYNEIVKAIAFSSLLALPLIFLDTIWWGFGLVCLSAFAIYIKTILKNEFSGNIIRVNGLVTVETIKTILLLLVSISAVVVFSGFVTDSAISVAGFLGVAESLIGVSILAFGTTLPEFSIALSAIKKNNIDIVIGDTIGSIVTNMTLVLGIASVANPIYLGTLARYSAAMLVAIGLVFLVMSSYGKFEKKNGIILLALFTVFICVIFAI